MLLIFCTKYYRQCSMLFFGSSQFRQELSLFAQFLLVTLLKLGPPFRFVSKPLPQRLARRNLLHPQIDMRLFFLDSARPQAVHQHAPSVVFLCRFVDSFVSNHGSRILAIWSKRVG